MKIFHTSQIRQLDKYTIDNEPILSIDLMERAAENLYAEIKRLFPEKPKFLILCGPGNNGGDGLAVARLMLSDGRGVEAILIYNDSLSDDCETNKKRFSVRFPHAFSEQKNAFSAPEIAEDAIIVDALFGSGLSRPLEGVFKETAEWINMQKNTVVSIDIPSGMSGEEIVNAENAVVQADYTLSLQFPKLSMLFRENEKWVGEMYLIDIQLHPQAIEKEKTNLYFLEKKDIHSLLKKRSPFSHKGNFGHICLMAGNVGMAGAAVLSAKAALRTGAGLVTVTGSEENRVILQTAVPEAIYKAGLNDVKNYTVFAAGCGIGTSAETKDTLFEYLKMIQNPCVLDADALNIISENTETLNFLPAKSILTPHLKEFERLFGKSNNSLERIELAQQKSKELDAIILLKGRFTAIFTPDGNVFFNSTGNPGMATGGTGDVLTGIIASLLAQNHTPENAAKIGVFLHGLAGDLALAEQSEESLIAGDLIDNLGKAFKELRITNCWAKYFLPVRFYFP